MNAVHQQGKPIIHRKIPIDSPIKKEVGVGIDITFKWEIDKEGDQHQGETLNGLITLIEVNDREASSIWGKTHTDPPEGKEGCRMESSFMGSERLRPQTRKNPYQSGVPSRREKLGRRCIKLVGNIPGV